MKPLLTVMVGVGFTVTLKVCAELVPQALEAVTEKIPLVPGAAEIEFVELEPLQPLGNDQVYDVAPTTVAIL
jgi:hypothetical protein